jgi:hypothetical protein
MPLIKYRFRPSSMSGGQQPSACEPSASDGLGAHFHSRNRRPDALSETVGGLCEHARHHDPQRCLTDNGPAYRSKVFNELLAGTGTKHKYTRPHTPRRNGKVERFNLTMKVEWLYVRPYSSDEERTAALADFLNTYSHDRPHSALGNKPPASRVPVTTYRVQPQQKVLPEPQIEGLGHGTHVVRPAVNNLMKWNG